MFDIWFRESVEPGYRINKGAFAVVLKLCTFHGSSGSCTVDVKEGGFILDLYIYKTSYQCIDDK